MCFLTNLPHVDRAAIQTNLSAGTHWVDRCRLDRLALWATYHPGQVARAKFVEKVWTLHERGVRMSVGVVGLRDHFEEIAQLRAEIPSDVYMWINACKRVSAYYSEADLRFLIDIDPQFSVNLGHHASLGDECWAGETSFTVDGAGLIRRCHFVNEPIGSIHDCNWRSGLAPRKCPRPTCGCFIGYVNLQRLEQGAVYGDGILERIPLTTIYDSSFQECQT